ncbi:MAG: hypothetical protein FWF03_02160 [Defluviitaleaceae bacterium]|nr:hypothetical protein [Defluviitaleaceae bacterium]
MKAALKYGIKSALRSPVKSALFLLLIAAAVGFLSLGYGMYRSAEAMLDEADKTFSTSAEFVFIGGNFPEGDYFDPALSEARAAFDLDDYALVGVEFIEHSARLLAFAQGYKPPSSLAPMPGFAVLQIRVGEIYPGTEYYNGTIYEDYFSANDIGVAKILVKPFRDEYFELTPNRVYIAFGVLTNSNHRFPVFEALAFADSLGLPKSEAYCPPVVDMTGAGALGFAHFWESEAGQYFSGIIEKLRLANMMVDLVASVDLKSLQAFHQGEYVLTDGEFPQSEAANECLLPRRVAAQLDLDVGDTVAISVKRIKTETYRYDTVKSGAGFDAVEDFTVSGIYRSEDQYSPIFIADAGQPWLAADKYDYVLACAKLENRSAAKYIEAIADSLPRGVIVNVSDQGYSEAVKPVRSLRETAVLITALCGFSVLVVLALFAYFYVYRAGESVRALLRLGSGALGPLLFLLSGAGIIAIASSAAGCAAGYAVSRRVADIVYATAAENNVYDHRFSALGFGQMAEGVSLTIGNAEVSFAPVALTVVAASFLICAAFGIKAVRSQGAKKRFKAASRKIERKRRADESHRNENLPNAGAKFFERVPGLTLRYAVKSAVRGGARSLAVPMLYFALLTFLFVFNDLREGYQAELDGVYDAIPVTMRHTGVRSYQTENLSIDPQLARDLIETGFIESVWYSRTVKGNYGGSPGRADFGGEVESGETGADYDLFVFTAPASGFELETMVWTFDSNSFNIVFTDDLTEMREFQSFNSPEIDRDEKYDWYKTADDGGFVKNALVSRRFAELHGLSAGDLFYVNVLYESSPGVYGGIMASPYAVAGLYESDVNRQSVFVYEEIFTQELTYETVSYFSKLGVTYEHVEKLTDYSYSSMGYALRDTEKLSQLKDFLAKNYDAPGRPGVHRNWIIVDDKALYQTIDSLTRHIGYMGMLFPAVLCAVALIGFFASNLLLKNRFGEINTLRSIGAGRLRVFAAFFIEPVILSVPGVLLASAAVAITGAAPVSVPMIALFSVCYNAGQATAVLHTFRKAVIASLGADE